MPLLANQNQIGLFSTPRHNLKYGARVEPQVQKYLTTKQAAVLGVEGSVPPNARISATSTTSKTKGSRLRVGRRPNMPPRPPNVQRPQKLSSKQSKKLHGKRAVDPSTKLPPSRRQRQSGPEHQLINEAYVRSKFELPKREDYPLAPSSLFESPQNYILNNPRLIQSNPRTSLHEGIWRCEITSKLADTPPVSAIGEAPVKSAAEKSACLHVIAQLHKLGILKEIYTGLSIDQETLQTESDAKEDVYNYAARFECVPSFSTRLIPRAGRGSSRRIFEVTIELPEQDIKVTARGLELKAAEVSASIKFKKEAEEYHARHGNDRMVIKDSNILNTGNVRNFFDFYKYMNPRATVEASVMSKSPSGLFQGQITIDGQPIGEPVNMIGKTKTEQIAFLTAAIVIVKNDKEVFHQFLQAPKTGNGAVLRPLSPVRAPIDPDCVFAMIETLQEARRRGLPDAQEDITENCEVDVKRLRPRVKLRPDAIRLRNMELQKRLNAYLENPALAGLRAKREELPMNQYRAQVIDLVENNTHSIIVGATGSGKTTQVPQILLGKAISEGVGAQCNIICTQPRRIAATSVARRVVVERNEMLQETVGYHVRFDVKPPRFGGSITYCTTGILLQQLQHGADEILNGISHLIIDEVHERDTTVDFLLILLKNVQRHRKRDGKPLPKIILMSATLDTELFEGYFGHIAADGTSTSCPSLSVPGRTFPVQERYLDEILETLQRSYPKGLGILHNDPTSRDYLEAERRAISGVPTAPEYLPDTSEATIDWKSERNVSHDGNITTSSEQGDALVPIGLTAITVAHISKTTKEGAILVFLPGLAEIVQVEEALRTQNLLGINFSNELAFKISKLHSSIPTVQTEVFNAVPTGCRKIILATNIAETSITIPDVQFVVDTGKLREKQYDQVRRITKLQCTWISKSNAKQRAGRAGRVQDGNYYALFSKKRFNSLRVIGLPELLRSDLQEICLDIKSYGFKSSIRETLAEAIDPPSPKAVDASVTELVKLDALTDDEKLTPLGKLLASMPVHPSLGKMIVLGVVFRCLDPILILGAASNERSLFVSPLERRRESDAARHSFAQGSGSDHIALVNAFREMRHARTSRGERGMTLFAQSNFLHLGAFRAIDNTIHQIEGILVDAGLTPFTPPSNRYRDECGDPKLNENASNVPLIKALILAGTYPNIGISTSSILFRTPGEGSVMIHPSSINHVAPKHAKLSKAKIFPQSALLTYSNMVKSLDGKGLFLRETSETTALTAILFGGRLRIAGNIIEMDGWLPFYIKSEPRAAKAILEFRKGLDRLLMGTFNDLSNRGDGSCGFLADSPTRAVFAKGVVEILDRDVKTRESARSKGWRTENQANSLDSLMAVEFPEKRRSPISAYLS
ncbi:MAG: ATP-dependent RNA helicase A [Geoglossum simile]|nr:MAG: ATP-dependent RNA helicase A [Geoglossum simile]